jgi:membrane-bound lytic murein transglycosylase MltF
MIGSTSSQRFYPAAGNCARRNDGRNAGTMAASRSRSILLRCVALALTAILSCAANGAVGSDPVLLQRFEDLRASDDLDGMVKRRFVRALVVYSKTFYFIDRGRERGMFAEGIQAFETYLNRSLKIRKPNEYVHVVAVPVARDQLVPWLIEGRGDIAMANLTITDQRARLIDFSAPFYEDATEILVTAADVDPPKTPQDLSDQDVYMRRSSSYFESLVRLNLSLRGTAHPVRLRLVDERLEDEDLLELINARVIDRIVMDDYKARFWARIFPNVRLHPDIVLSRGGKIAFGLRKDSPRLKALLDQFVASHKLGTAIYNDAYNRYFHSTRWVKNPASERERAKFLATIELFKRYGEQYGFDPLMLAAQAYQESGLDQRTHSERGAIGVMQVLPETGRLMKVGDIRRLEPNVHAGCKYLRALVDEHFADPQIDPFNRTLFAFAAYNAGPTRIAGLRRETEQAGLKPNTWFNNVERVVAQRVGRETVQYVANIYKYYVSYALLERHLRTREQVKGPTP